MTTRGTLWLVAALIGLATCIASVCMTHEPIGTWNDDSVYICQARQIVATGQAMDVLGSPRGLKFPLLPGESFCLVPIVTLFPGSVTALRWASFACMAVAAVLFGLAARPRLGPAGAVLLGACLLFCPATMIHGTSVLSETSFTLLLAALVLGMQRMSGATTFRWPPVLIGLGLACLTIIRLQGGIVLIAVLGVFASRREWRNAALCSVAMALGSVPFMGFYRVYFSGHRDMAVPQVAAWWGFAPMGVGQELVGLQSGAWWAGLAMLLLVATGLIRQWRIEGVGIGTVLVPLLVLHYMLWPYFSARYFLPIWPLMLMAAWYALPRVPVVAFLSVMLVLSGIGLTRVMAESRARVNYCRTRWQTYDWLRDHSDAGDVVEEMVGWRPRLLADRPWSAPGQPIESVSQFLAEACHDHARFVLVEPDSDLVPDVSGDREFPLPPRIDAWLDSSSLVERAYASPWDRLYRIKVDGNRFVDAFQHFYRGTHSAASIGELRLCLQEVEDFPEARTALAVLLFQQSRSSTAEAIRLLQKEVAQYPVDAVAALDLAQVYRLRGDLAHSRSTLETEADVARRLRLPAAVQAQIHEALYDLPR